MATYRRADALEPGDVIEVGEGRYHKVYEAVRGEGDTMHLTTGINGWSRRYADEWTTDYRTRFAIVQ